MSTSIDDETEPGRELTRATVAVVGMGALGCPAALQLAAAGVGTLILIDPDRVELSNLHRQSLHRTSAIGMLKVESAAARLRERHPAVHIEPRAAALDAAAMPALCSRADFVIDATDGSAAKYLINDGAVRGHRPFSHAGVIGFLGQAMTVLPGRSACLRCVFPEPPAAGELPSCREAGVIGGIAGVVGSLQAAEAITYLLGETALLTDALLTVDALTGRWRRVRVRRDPHCRVCAAGPAGARKGTLDAPSAARYGGETR